MTLISLTKEVLIRKVAFGIGVPIIIGITFFTIQQSSNSDQKPNVSASEDSKIEWTKENLKRLERDYPGWTPEHYEKLVSRLESTCKQFEKLGPVISASHYLTRNNWRIEFEIETTPSGDSFLNSAARYTSEIRDVDGAWDSFRLPGRLYFNWKRQDKISVYLVVSSHDQDPNDYFKYFESYFRTLNRNVDKELDEKKLKESTGESGDLIRDKSK